MLDQPQISPDSQACLPFLVLLFIGSGSAALIYEIVWFQMLGLVIGSSAISLGVLLGTFMGGMCLGSLLAPRFISRNYHPLRVYAAMELGIGIIGLLLLVGMPLVGGLYTTWAGHGAIRMVLRGAVAGICLLPPTSHGRRCRQSHAGCKPLLKAFRGSVFFTAGILAGP